MSSLRLSGTTSGYYDLTVPAAAGTNSIDLSNLLTSSGNITINGNITQTKSDTALAHFKTTATNTYAEVLIQDGNAGYSWQTRSDNAQSTLNGSFLLNDRRGTFPIIIEENNPTNTLKLSNGYVLAPSQPAFRASPSAGVNLTSSGTIIFPDVSGNPDFNTGGHYNTSNGRFTCPTAGVYMFCFSAYKQTNQSYGDIDIQINGVDAGEVRKFNSNGSHETMEGTFIFKLNASDYVSLQNESPTLHLNSNNSYFSGYLIG